MIRGSGELMCDSRGKPRASGDDPDWLGDYYDIDE